MSRRWLFHFALLVMVGRVTAQTFTHRSGGTAVKGFDTAYVHDYSHLYTGRLYLSTKFNQLGLAGARGLRITYRPNNRYNIGAGLSYRSVTLNIGVGIPGLNRDQDKRGTTRYLDAQANIYTKRSATNLFLQGFQGYYMSSHTKDELGWNQETAFPTRPDIREYNLGISRVHIFNHDRFSYRAAFNQDAWQRKSQGSLLAGWYLTYFRLQADSSLVPVRLATAFKPGLHLVRGGFTDLGASIGYAYTLVVREHFFLTCSMVLGGGISAQRATTAEKKHENVKTDFGLGWHAQMRAAIGYNSERYCLGMSFNQENIGYLMEERDLFRWGVGNIRVNLARRLGRKDAYHPGEP